MSAIVQEFEHSLALPFFGIGMKTAFFKFCGNCWVFQICWHIEYSTFTASSFRVSNSSAVILSSPLTLFVVMLSKAHLIHIPVCVALGVITPSWKSGSLRSFLYSSSMYSCYLFISSASVRSIPFLCFIVSIFAWNVPLVSLISLKGSLVFPILLFFSISLHWLWRKTFLPLLLFCGTLHSDGYIFPFLLCLLPFFFTQHFVRPPQTTVLPFFISFSWEWFWSQPLVQCYEHPSIVLSIRSNPLNLFVTFTV